MHVLLVEPYPDLRDVLIEMLTGSGCAVDAAMTGYEMQRALATNQYDVVLLNIDQNRKRDYGLDLADAASASGSRIIVIPDNETDVATIAAKGWLHLTKPFTVRSLRAMLEQAVGPAGTESAKERRSRAPRKQAEAKDLPSVG